jgi:hypothetical protein
MDNSVEARSSFPSQPKEAPRELPSLPTEILQRIIQLALPQLSFKTFRERYDLLLTCCRVNKLWAALAQEELWRHVGLRGSKAADLFLKQKAAVDAGRSRSRSLRLLTGTRGFNRTERLQVEEIADLLGAMAGVSVLQIVADTSPVLVLDLGLLRVLAEGAPTAPTPDRGHCS